LSPRGRGTQDGGVSESLPAKVHSQTRQGWLVSKGCCASAHANEQQRKNTLRIAQKIAYFPLVYHDRPKQGLVNESSYAIRQVHLGMRWKRRDNAGKY
jgi:hypothetical protein